MSIDRRELLNGVFGSGVVAAAGLPEGTQARTVEKDKDALALVITLPEGVVDCSDAQVARIKQMVEGRLGPDCPPVLVVPGGTKVNLLRSGGPYSFREKLSEYEHEYTFGSLGEMEKFLARNFPDRFGKKKGKA
jgi:hypothetical protein